MSRKTARPLPVLLPRQASTVFSYRTRKGATFEPGEYHAAVTNEAETLYNLTHSQTGEVVCFCQTEVIDPKSTLRSLEVQQAAASEMLRRRALPGSN